MAYTSTRDLLRQDQILAIGLINAEWAMLEATVSVAIWDYCGLDRQKGLGVTADLGSLAKISMLEALARIHFKHDSELIEEIAAIAGRMEKLNSERNVIAHNLWEMDYIADTMRTKRPTTKRGKLKETPISRNSEQLIKTFQDITMVIAELADFQRKHVARLP